MKFEQVSYWILKAVWLLFSMLPLTVMYFLSDGLFYLFYYLIRYRRRITRKNLIESFPEKDIREIMVIEKRFYHFFLDLFFETCKFATISEKEIRKRMKFIHTEEINRVLANGKSISLYLGHYGNWEWVSSVPIHMNQGVRAGQIYKRLHNKLFDRLLRFNRTRFQASNIEMKETFRWISEHVQNQEITVTGYIADQSPRKKDIRYYVHFLNHRTPVLTGTEKMTKRFGMEAYYLDIKRIKRGYYEASYLKLHNDPEVLPDYKLTEIYYHFLENTVKRKPEFYLWTHNRFKYATLERTEG